MYSRAYSVDLIPTHVSPNSRGICLVSIVILQEGTSELVEDIEDESSNSDTEREGSDDEGHGLKDEGPSLYKDVAPEGEGSVPSTCKVGQSSRSVLEHEGSWRISAFRQPTLVTWVDTEDGKVYTDIPTYVSSVKPVQTPPSPEWSFGSLPVSPSSPVASPATPPAATISVDEDQFLEVGAQLELYESILHDDTRPLDALPPTLFEGYDRDLRELYTRMREARDKLFSQRYRLRSLEKEKATVTFRALWRLVLALEAWAGHVDARSVEMSQARYDDHRLIHDMLVPHVAM
nr:hypothetical protein [Tanacetum cinerariifolium]GEY08844.1 hypothetical protein [Tanacetum cinerariifolium]